MSPTNEDIVAELRQAIEGPLGVRSLAGAMRRKGLELVQELRADCSWEQIARLFTDNGLPATAESIRRTVRRQEDRDGRRSHAPTVPAQAWPTLPATHEHPFKTEGSAAGSEHVPPATGPPATPRKIPAPGATALVAGGVFLDQSNKLKELNK